MIKVGEYHWDLGLGKEFLDLMMREWSIKGKIEKVALSNYKCYSLKDSAKNVQWMVKNHKNRFEQRCIWQRLYFYI
jgi:hypothetical protein